ncbi:hypothetical protein Lser_V15G23828 [Lactuca serriola]
MGDMEFAKVHKSAIFLEDPPAAHNDLKFIVDGLKKSCLVHVLTTSPAIYQSLIKDFWRNAVVKKNDQGEKFVEETIEDKKIQVTENIIRESLQIEDRPKYPMEIDVHQTQKVLEHMGYEVTFPPTIKKLLPPCWKYLAHVFVSCISGRRSGENEISLANTGAIVALVAGFEFNFSKFIMNEMILNLEGSKRDKFWMYPRFLQIILNVTHPELQRGNDTLDFKSIGPSAFGLMKQKRCGKLVFEGKYPLIKFGIFKENDREESEEQSMSMENEDIFHSPSEPEVEEIHDSPTTCVADENDLQKANESKSSREDDDDDLYEDVEFLKEIDFTGINDDIPTNIEFDLGDEDFDPFLDIPSSRVNKVNEVASLVTKTRDEGNVLKMLLSTSKPLEVAPSQGDVTSEIPPSVPLISTSAPVSSDSPEPQTCQTSIKTCQSLASLEVPAVRCAPQVLLTITATSAHSPPKQTDEGPSTIFETANYFNLKNVLYDVFGEKVKALFQQPHGIADPLTVQSPSATDDLPVNSPAPRSTTIINRFEKEPEGSKARITIKQGKRIITANQSEGLLFMKNSNENRKATDPVLTVTDLKKRKFGDEYGDRSGIRMWAFDPETNLWVVKRNSGASECYKITYDFNSWTKTDLAELCRAPFHSHSNNPSASNFKRFLDRQVRENFPSMKTARALYRKDKDVLDPESDEPMKIILWPATKKQKEIPIPQHFHEGYLDNMDFWAYDDETATAAIKFKD